MLPCCPASGWRPAGIAACSLPWLHHTWPGPAGPPLSPYGAEHPSAQLAWRLPGWWKMLQMAGGLRGLASFSWVWPARPWTGAMPEGAQEHPHAGDAAASSHAAGGPGPPGTGMWTWVQETQPVRREGRCSGQLEQHWTPPCLGTLLWETLGQPAPCATASPHGAQPRWAGVVPLFAGDWSQKKTLKR